MVTRYNPNFIEGKGGNILKAGDDLIIKVDREPSYIIGRLFYKKSLFRKKLIQIEQTGSANNPEKDQIKFEMSRFTKGNLEHMPKGKYRVSCYAYFPDIGGKRWGDDFEIVS